MALSQIKGQDRTIRFLKEYIKKSDLQRGLLFIGPEGIGKKSVAINLAKAINCQQAQDDSCDLCLNCTRIDKRQYPDFFLIEDSESESIKIDQIRQLKTQIYLKPYEAKIKVFILDNVHNLTSEAGNAILKILEEPPQKSLIILITSTPYLLFKTIISRCQIFRFYPLKRTALKEMLIKEYKLDTYQAHFLAYFFEGRIGKTLTLKDTDILNYKNRIIDEFLSEKIGDSQRISFGNRQDLRNYINILLSWFRDLYLIKTGIRHSEIINIDRLDILLKTMNKYSFIELDQIINFLSDSLLYLEQNVNPKLLISAIKTELWKT
ncbi:MAG: AAA family ATPase [Candidatus Omnitrophica bacterium]|nr:AAA family ATPase [Candidatus Omnitrophota bacterium]